MEPLSLLQRYRRGRRKLLEFLLSSDLIKELRTPSGLTNAISDIGFDSLSADYGVDCAKYGGVFDISVATDKYLHESSYPVMIHLDLEVPIIFYFQIQILLDHLLGVLLHL